VHQKNFLIHIFEIMNEKKRKKEKNMSKKNIPIEKLDVFLLKNLQFLFVFKICLTIFQYFIYLAWVGSDIFIIIIIVVIWYFFKYE